MSRKRISRPSASSRTSRTYGSSGRVRRDDEQLAGHLEVDGQRGVARQLDDDELRPPADAPRPAGRRSPSANASGVCVRSVRAHERGRPMIVAPTMRGRRSRATVSTSGSSGIGAKPTPSVGASGASSSGASSRLGGDRVGAGQRRHRFPVVADLDVDGQRDVERQGALHRLAQRAARAGRPRRAGPRAAARRGPGAAAAPGSPPARSRSSSRIIAILTMSAAVPWIGMLMAIRSPAARSVGLRAASSGIWRFRPSSVVDVALGPRLLLDREHVVADPRIRREVGVDERLRLGPRDVRPLRQPEVAQPVGDPEVDHLGHRPLAEGDLGRVLVEDAARRSRGGGRRCGRTRRAGARRPRRGRGSAARSGCSRRRRGSGPSPPATNARRIRRPSGVRIGMFWRFGSDDDRRPVAATAWWNVVWRRPSAAIRVGSASTYVERSFV